MDKLTEDIKLFLIENEILQNLAKKHSLIIKRNGKSIEDFPYNDEIANDFKNHGFDCNIMVSIIILTLFPMHRRNNGRNMMN